MLVISDLRCTLHPATSMKTLNARPWVVQTRMYGAGVRSTEAATTEGIVLHSVEPGSATERKEKTIAWPDEVVLEMPPGCALSGAGELELTLVANEVPVASCVVWLADVTNAPIEGVSPLRATLRSVAGEGSNLVEAVGYLWLKLRSAATATGEPTKPRDVRKAPVVFDPTVWALQGDRGGDNGSGVADDDASDEGSTEHTEASVALALDEMASQLEESGPGLRLVLHAWPPPPSQVSNFDSVGLLGKAATQLPAPGAAVDSSAIERVAVRLWCCEDSRTEMDLAGSDGGCFRWAAVGDGMQSLIGCPASAALNHHFDSQQVLRVAVREVPDAVIKAAARANEPLTSAAARVVSVAVSCVPLKDLREANHRSSRTRSNSKNGHRNDDDDEDDSSSDDQTSTGSSSSSTSSSGSSGSNSGSNSDSSEEDSSSDPNQHQGRRKRRRRKRRDEGVGEHVYESAADRKARASLLNLSATSSDHGRSIDSDSNGLSSGSGLGVELFFEATSATEAEHFALAVKSLASDARRRAADSESKREARNGRVGSTCSGSRSRSSSSSHGSKIASNLKAPRWSGRWEEEKEDPALKVASSGRGSEAVALTLKTSSAYLKKPSVSEQHSSRGSTVYSGVLGGGHEESSSSSVISKEGQHRSDYSDIEAGNHSGTESSGSDSSDGEGGSAGTIERRRLSLVEQMPPIERAVFLSELAKAHEESISNTEQRRQRKRGKWKRRKRRNEADYLLCGMNRSEHKRLALIWSASIPPLIWFSFMNVIIFAVLALAIIACSVGIFGVWLLEEEDQNVRLYDERGKVIFNGFGTEKEIKATMRTIQDERLQRRQSLRDQVTNQQRQSNVAAARYSNRRGSSSSSFGWPASPAQQPSLAARFFGTSNANTTAGTTGDEFDSGDRIPVVRESRLASSAQASLDLTTSEEVTTTSPLPSAAVDTWAHAVDDAFALEIAPRPRPSISATAHSSAPASTLTATARRASLSQNVHPRSRLPSVWS